MNYEHYEQLWTLLAAQLNCRVLCTHGCSRGMTVIGVTNHFLFGFEAYSTRRYAQYHTGQKPISEAIIHWMGKHTTAALLADILCSSYCPLNIHFYMYKSCSQAWWKKSYFAVGSSHYSDSQLVKAQRIFDCCELSPKGNIRITPSKPQGTLQERGQKEHKS